MPDTLNDEIASQIEREMYNPRSIDSLLRRIEGIEERLSRIESFADNIQNAKTLMVRDLMEAIQDGKNDSTIEAFEHEKSRQDTEQEKR